MRKAAAFCALLALCCLLGCAPQAPVPLPVPTVSLPSFAVATPSPSPAPTPPPLDATEIESRLSSLFFEHLSFSFDDATSFLEADSDAHKGVYSAVERLPLFEDAAAQVDAAVRSAAEKAAAALESELGDFLAAHQLSGIHVSFGSLPQPDWKYMLSLLRSCALTDVSFSAEEALKAALAFSCSIRQEEGSLAIDAALSLPTFPDLWRQASDTPLQCLSGQFSYAYLLTVYDMDGVMKDYEEPADAAAHLASIVSPLQKGTIRKTWYADRDGGRRKHTGTDILAPEDTPIYSCAPGTVLYIGEGGGMGNYVIIADEAGYEYHYYHMVRMTDFLAAGEAVAAGELIGHVGNTGNSSANHLHLSILHPSGAYINPYPYLVAARAR